MEAIRIKDPNTGQWIGIVTITGTAGTSAYDYAVSAGYTGTVEEFAADLAAISGLSTELAEI